MAHFAKLDSNNTVLEVVVVNNDDIGNLSFPDSESVGIQFLNNIFPDTLWAQTSYNSNFRVRYAGIGYTFIPTCSATPHGGFAPPKDADYFVWDEQTCQWIPPISYPANGLLHVWDFELRQWVLSQYQISVAPQVIG